MMSASRAIESAACLMCASLLVACNQSRPEGALSTISHGRLPSDGSVASQAWYLEESDRRYLWKLEHYSNVLVKYGFGRIADAVKAEDYEALDKLFSEELVVTSFAKPSETFLDNHILTAVRSTGDGEQTTLSRQGLLAMFEKERSHFREEPRIRFDVKTISPLERHDLAGQWTALCVMRMWGDGENGPREASIVFNAKFASPTKKRMADPGWLLEFSIEQFATSRASRFLFREVAEQYNIDTGALTDNWESAEPAQNSGGVFACDFDRDGYVDLLVTDTKPQGNFLLKGTPNGGFKNVTAEVGLQTVGHMGLQDASFADIDNDGWEDLVFARGIIFRNLEGKKFAGVPQTNLAKLTKGFSPSMESSEFTVCVADYDRDGLLDLYVIRSGGRPTSWLEDAIEEPVSNVLLRNLGDWQFDDVTALSGTDAGKLSAFTALWLDANNDLWPDLYVINEYGDGLLHVNQHDGSFEVLDADDRTADFGSMGATCGDIDNDGNIDIYIGSMYSKAGSRVIGNIPHDVYPDEVMFKLQRLISGSELYQNEGDLSFKARGESYQVHDVGWSWGPTMADFNNDGFLDIFATAGYISRDRTKPDG